MPPRKTAAIGTMWSRLQSIFFPRATKSLLAESTFARSTAPEPHRQNKRLALGRFQGVRGSVYLLSPVGQGNPLRAGLCAYAASGGIGKSL